ncbi:MAG: hypothetical protein AAB871_02910 [Patescibacteria group bacterium]
MDQDKKIEKQFEAYKNLAKENKRMDVAALMVDALWSENKNSVSPRLKKWAYLISVIAPPFGLLFALKFYFDDKADAKIVANICVILTIITFVFYLILFNMLLSGSGASLDQIRQIKPEDIRELYQ